MKLKLIKRLKSFLIPTMAAMSLSLGVAGCSSSGDETDVPDAEMAMDGNNTILSNNNLNSFSNEYTENSSLNGENYSNNSNIAENPAGDELQGLVSNGSMDSAGMPMDNSAMAGDPFAEGTDQQDPFAADQSQVDPLAVPQQPALNAPPEDAFAGTGDVADESAGTESESYEDEVAEDVAPAPAGVSMPGAVPEVGTQMAYYVATGDTLGTIAEKIYGSRAKWREIAQENNITNPNKIFPGDVVYYTVNDNSKAFAEKYESAPRQSVTVAAGDTLSSISARVYGTQGAWRTLWKENSQIKNPDVIAVGSTISYRVHNQVAKLDNDEDMQVVKQKSDEADLNHDQDAIFDLVVMQE